MKEVKNKAMLELEKAVERLKQTGNLAKKNTTKKNKPSPQKKK